MNLSAECKCTPPTLTDRPGTTCPNCGHASRSEANSTTTSSVEDTPAQAITLASTRRAPLSDNRAAVVVPILHPIPYRSSATRRPPLDLEQDCEAWGLAALMEEMEKEKEKEKAEKAKRAVDEGKDSNRGERVLEGDIEQEKKAKESGEK